MKSVLISIQPYWVFLIIANKMGWYIDKEKTVEVRKNYPKDENWDKVVKIYCGKDKNSFNRIPKEYQPLMERFLGKIIGEFVCKRISEWHVDPQTKGYFITSEELTATCLTYEHLHEYGNGKTLYGWHISNLVIYDKPRELSEFYTKCDEGCENCDFWKSVRVNADEYDMECSSSIYGHRTLKRPPQSWCYVESEVDAE